MVLSKLVWRCHRTNQHGPCLGVAIERRRQGILLASPSNEDRTKGWDKEKAHSKQDQQGPQGSQGSQDWSSSCSKYFSPKTI